MEQHWGQNRLDKSGFTRRLHALTDTLHALFALVGDWLKQQHLEARDVLDSFPGAVCHTTRIPRCKLLTGKAYHGRCASKRSWFYGLKVQVVATSNGVPVAFHLHAGGESEQAGRRGLPLALPAGSVLYPDAGYTDYVAEDLFKEARGSQQQPARRKDSKRPHHPAQRFLLPYFRKRLDPTGSQLTARFAKQIHAVTAQGFALKIALFLFAHPLHQAGC
ncbi:MAG: transposase [Janthinobacterium lividum]